VETKSRTKFFNVLGQHRTMQMFLSESSSESPYIQSLSPLNISDSPECLSPQLLQYINVQVGVRDIGSECSLFSSTASHSIGTSIWKTFLVWRTRRPNHYLSFQLRRAFPVNNAQVLLLQDETCIWSRMFVGCS
jgi:hypothetical protein